MGFSKVSNHPCGAILSQNNTSLRGKVTVLCWLLPISSLSFYQYLSRVTLIFLHLQFVSPIPSWQPHWEDSLHESCQLGFGAEVIVTSAMKGLMWAETTLGSDLGYMWLSCQKDVALS